MLRLLIILLLAVGIAPAYAQQPAQATEQPRPYDSLSQRDREREMQAQQWQGPSGMWTSPHKAEGGAYRYRLMGIGVALVLLMGLVMWRLIKRTKGPAARGAYPPGGGYPPSSRDTPRARG